MIESDQSSRRPRLVVAFCLLAAAVVVVAAGWRFLTDGQAPYGDDNSAHLALMMHIAELWRAGVTDLWWNQPNLGLPLFMAYQPLPALASGTIASFFSGTSAQLFVYKGSIIGLWALMPAAWYLGARWIGFDRTTSVCVGVLTLAVKDIHSVGFGFTAVSYGGLYTQVWGMFLLPMTVGAFKRYVVDRQVSLFVPVALFVLVSTSHLFCGMYAGIATLLWCFATPGKMRSRLIRAFTVYAIALGLLAFWLVPLLSTSHLAGGLPWKNEYFNGWPIATLFGNIFTGEVFDYGRLPWVTACLIGGLSVASLRTGERKVRWLLGLFAATLILFMGRTTFGTWYNLIPMHTDVNVMRYMNGVHFCGLFFAGMFARRVGGLIRGIFREKMSRRWRRVVFVGTLLAVGITYGACRYGAIESTLSTFDQTHPNVRQTIDQLSEGRGQRFAVSEKLNTTPHFFRDLLPALAGRAQLQSYALGYHATLSTYYADYIDYTSEAWARLFNVGHYLSRDPFEREATESLQRVFRQGPFSLYRPKGDSDWGYFDFVVTPVTVEGGYRQIRPAVRKLLVPGFEQRVLPRLVGPTAKSRRAGAPIMTGSEVNPSAKWSASRAEEWKTALLRHAPDRSVESRVLSARRGANWHEATVESAGRPERLMLKVNYFPYWRATVDGESVSINHIAPNFMAVDVPAGRHEVRFSYRNPWWQKYGFAGTVLILLVWGGVAGGRRWKSFRSE